MLFVGLLKEDWSTVLPQQQQNVYISISMLTFLQTIHSLSINVLNLYDIPKRICLEKSFVLHMLSVLILSQRSLVTMPMARQLLYQRLNISGPLVQGNGFLNSSRAPQVESKLSHDVLNSTQVPFYSANSRTLGTFFSPRIWSVNIEVPNNSVDKDSWELLACYP